ncbi:hypothetical protein A7G45_02625 [Mycolicibacterium llatzerense]|nr:hypothetical protein [Mycolicibacterium llatzerense]
MPYASAGGLYCCHLFALRPAADHSEVWYVDIADAALHRLCHIPSNEVGAAVFEPWAWPSGCLIAIVVDFRRICGKYGLRGLRFGMFESGSIAQIVRQQAFSMGLGSCVVGGYSDDSVLEVLDLDPEWFGIAMLIAAGAPAGQA